MCRNVVAQMETASSAMSRNRSRRRWFTSVTCALASVEHWVGPQSKMRSTPRIRWVRKLAWSVGLPILAGNLVSNCGRSGTDLTCLDSQRCVSRVAFHRQSHWCGFRLDFLTEPLHSASLVRSWRPKSWSAHCAIIQLLQGINQTVASCAMRFQECWLPALQGFQALRPVISPAEARCHYPAIWKYR